MASRRSRLRKDTRDGRAIREQMGEKPGFLEESLTIAHGSMMAFDEEAAAWCPDDASRGKRARACKKDLRRFAQVGESSENWAQFIERKRWPVGIDQRAVHAMGFRRCAHCGCVLHRVQLL